MDLPQLYDGRILARYKRFLVDVELAAGGTVTAHCPNTGSMRSCWRPGAPVQLSCSSDPRRKLAWTLERVDMGSGWIGVNTHRVNGIIAEAAGAGCLPGLERLRHVSREVRVAVPHDASSRLDLLLEGDGHCAYVEIKNTTLLEGSRLCFPDAVSIRARKHLEALEALVRAGNRAIILFALNRPEGSAFTPADAIDPGYGRVLRRAMAAGVEVLALRLRHGARSISVAGPVAVEL